MILQIAKEQKQWLWISIPNTLDTNIRAKTIEERTRFCEYHVCFEIAALFPSPTRQGKKGGNFKTSMRFTEIRSYTVLALRIYRMDFAIDLNR